MLRCTYEWRASSREGYEEIGKDEEHCGANRPDLRSRMRNQDILNTVTV